MFKETMLSPEELKKLAEEAKEETPEKKVEYLPSKPEEEVEIGGKSDEEIKKIIEEAAPSEEEKEWRKEKEK